MKKRIFFHKSLIIRPLQAGDTHELLAFANALIEEDTFLMLSGKKLTLVQEKKYVTDELNRMKKHESVRFVVTLGDTIIGSAKIRRGDRRKHHVGEIGISVLKPYRGEGIGKILMELLIAEGKRLGLRMLMLHCFENNIAALTLYKKFGFAPCGVLPQALNYRGKYIGEVTMYTTL